MIVPYPFDEYNAEDRKLRAIRDRKNKAKNLSQRIKLFLQDLEEEDMFNKTEKKEIKSVLYQHIPFQEL